MSQPTQVYVHITDIEMINHSEKEQNSNSLGLKKQYPMPTRSTIGKELNPLFHRASLQQDVDQVMQRTRNHSLAFYPARTMR
jgi:hypothetical protein